MCFFGFFLRCKFDYFGFFWGFNFAKISISSEEKKKPPPTGGLAIIYCTRGLTHNLATGPIVKWILKFKKNGSCLVLATNTETALV
jgi:hypothetical protein